MAEHASLEQAMPATSRPTASCSRHRIPSCMVHKPLTCRSCYEGREQGFPYGPSAT